MLIEPEAWKEEWPAPQENNQRMRNDDAELWRSTKRLNAQRRVEKSKKSERVMRKRCSRRELNELVKLGWRAGLQRRRV
jgi:hypothetical protein